MTLEPVEGREYYDVEDESWITVKEVITNEEEDIPGHVDPLALEAGDSIVRIETVIGDVWIEHWRIYTDLLRPEKPE